MKRKEIPEYRIWKAMKARCYAPCNKEMGNYQSDNITVCDKWLNDFDAFLKDMGKRPSKKHSIDRIDTLKGYCPENCRWTTQDVQCSNRGTFNRIFTYNDETLVLKDWARKFGISYTTLYSRIYRYGLTFEKAIQKDPYGRKIEINGESLTVKEWCKKLNLHYGTVINRIHDGYTPIEAILKPFTRKKKNQPEQI